MPEDPQQLDPQPKPRSTPGGTYVCNVQSWGASPTYSQGEIIPEDCPYDVEAAAKSGKVVTVEEYKKAHPEWDPAAQAQAEQEKAEFEQAFPGRDLPTAADPPDPEAEQELYAEPAPEQQARAKTAEEKPAEGQPVQVQQGSAPPKPSGGSGSGSKS